MPLTALPNEVLHRILKFLYPPGYLELPYTSRYPLSQLYLFNEYWDLLQMAFVSRRFRSIVLESYEHFSKVLPKGSREATEHGGLGYLLTSTGEDVEYEELLNPSTP
ncbi:hypothetical protein JMJ35_010461 [Cladonia borealis]|uniref:F-box domain-containing protein n=1 Tax=Cladonia borealis TaxID=184061 RepID=A0AA39QQ05_9LECA|nr:hypothetical protein JMJ35_010461 [Cladonia borealis]